MRSTVYLGFNRKESPLIFSGTTSRIDNLIGVEQLGTISSGFQQPGIKECSKLYTNSASSFTKALKAVVSVFINDAMP